MPKQDSRLQFLRTVCDIRRLFLLSYFSSLSKLSFLLLGDSCQYWMDLEKQTLSSPYYPQYYFADCEWLITAPEGHIISLEFVEDSYLHVTMFDGVCDETKKIETLYGSMPNDVKWIISSSGNYMFVRFDKDIISGTGFSANVHYGK